MGMSTTLSRGPEDLRDIQMQDVPADVDAPLKRCTMTRR
jgi:hypothetical protein